MEPIYTMLCVAVRMRHACSFSDFVMRPNQRCSADAVEHHLSSILMNLRIVQLKRPCCRVIYALKGDILPTSTPVVGAQVREV